MPDRQIFRSLAVEKVILKVSFVNSAFVAENWDWQYNTAQRSNEELDGISILSVQIAGVQSQVTQTGPDHATSQCSPL